jgi:hypothetical protein
VRSRIDTRTGEDGAPSVTRDPARLINHVGRPIAAWDEGGGGTGTGYADNRPSRTAIDFYGDMWVANRAHDGGNSQPSITKIMNDNLLCPDLNGNGLVDTSREVNGTPGIQLTDPAEFFGEADECIVMTVVVGDLGGTARALAIDAGDGIGGGNGRATSGQHGVSRASTRSTAHRRDHAGRCRLGVRRTARRSTRSAGCGARSLLRHGQPGADRHRRTRRRSR